MLDTNACHSGTMPETYGREEAYVWALANGDKEQCVWTLLDCDGGMTVVPGFHYVNRFGYFVTEVPWKPEDKLVLNIKAT